jgi:tRNA A37 threonylcarbamoyladenosine modification protein TsaB
MYLIIDNTTEGLIRLLFVLNNKVVQKKYHGNAGSNLIVCLDRALSSLKRKLADINGVGVMVGAGRFTATRLAVTAANTLAYVLHVPVAALPSGLPAANYVREIKKAKTGRFALPEYSGEAHIGGKN